MLNEIGSVSTQRTSPYKLLHAKTHHQYVARRFRIHRIRSWNGLYALLSRHWTILPLRTRRGSSTALTTGIHCLFEAHHPVRHHRSLDFACVDAAGRLPCYQNSLLARLHTLVRQATRHVPHHRYVFPNVSPFLCTRRRQSLQLVLLFYLCLPPLCTNGQLFWNCRLDGSI